MEDLQAYYDRIAAAGGPILRPVESYYEEETVSKVQFCKAQVEDRTIFFELAPSQFYGQGKQEVPIHWEDNGQVKVGEMSLEDIMTLDIQPE